MNHKAKHRRAPYCLYCYTPLDIVLAPNAPDAKCKVGSQRSSGAAVHCPQCDELNLIVDTQQLWTKEPGLVELENWLKIAVLALSGILTCVGLYCLAGVGHFQVYGVAVTAGMFFAIMCYDMVSITSKRNMLRPTIICSLSALFIGALALWGRNYPWSQASLLTSIGFLLLTSLSVATPWMIRHRWLTWRDARIGGHPS